MLCHRTAEGIQADSSVMPVGATFAREPLRTRAQTGTLGRAAGIVSQRPVWARVRLGAFPA